MLKGIRISRQKSVFLIRKDLFKTQKLQKLFSQSIVIFIEPSGKMVTLLQPRDLAKSYAASNSDHSFQMFTCHLFASNVFLGILSIFRERISEVSTTVTR